MINDNYRASHLGLPTVMLDALYADLSHPCPVFLYFLTHVLKNGANARRQNGQSSFLNNFSSSLSLKSCANTAMKCDICLMAFCVSGDISFPFKRSISMP